jgi:hypothetical protein
MDIRIASMTSYNSWIKRAWVWVMEKDGRSGNGQQKDSMGVKAAL